MQCVICQWWAWIFKYSNMQIKWPSNIIRAISPVRIYLDIHSLIFGQPNIFKYLFVNSYKSRIYLNICSEPYYNICISFFNEKSKSRYNLCIKKSSIPFYLEEAIVSPFQKYLQSVMSMIIQKCRIKLPSNIICIHICANFGVQIYSDIRSVNMGYPNILGYSFGT